jgi:nucleoside-diphosphate-sugar epimerase
LIGATGFIGQHICSSLLEQGHELRVLSRNTQAAAEKLALDDCFQGDLDRLEDIDFSELYQDIDAVIFAAGVDERADIIGDMDDFYYKHNVSQCARLIEGAKYHGVKKFTVLGSIFSFWDRQHPELNLSQNHAYIRSRNKQQEVCLRFNDEHFQVSVLEIPLVLGRAIGVKSVANSLAQYVRFSYPIFSLDGGMAVISVATLGQAVANLQSLDKFPPTLALSDENMSWDTLIGRFNKAMNKSPRPVKKVSSELFLELTQVGGLLSNLLRINSGLDQMHMAQIVNSEIFVDVSETKALLSYSGGDIEAAIEDTVAVAKRDGVAKPLWNMIDQKLSSFYQVSAQIKQKLFSSAS